MQSNNAILDVLKDAKEALNSKCLPHGKRYAWNGIEIVECRSIPKDIIIMVNVDNKGGKCQN